MAAVENAPATSYTYTTVVLGSFLDYSSIYTRLVVRAVGSETFIHSPWPLEAASGRPNGPHPWSGSRGDRDSKLPAGGDPRSSYTGLEARELITGAHAGAGVG